MTIDRKIDAFVLKLSSAGVPIRGDDNLSSLNDLEARLPGRISSSFESLLARYSFPEFDTCGISFFAWNNEWMKTEYFGASSGAKNTLSELLLPAGFMQIGRPDTGDFDAICLDLNSGKEHQCIVQVDHEEILCNYRVRVTAELWPSFLTIVDRVLSGINCEIYYEVPNDE